MIKFAFKKIISCMLAIVFIFTLTACAGKKQSEIVLPEGYDAWKAENVSVSGNVISSTSGGIIKNDSNAISDSVLETDFKLSANGKLELMFGMSGNAGLSAIVEQSGEMVVLYEVKGSKRKQIAVKPCVIKADAWYTARAELKDNSLKLYINDTADTAAKISMNVYKKGNECKVMLDNAEIKKLSVKANTAETIKHDSTFVNPVDYATQPNTIYYKGVYYMYGESADGLSIEVYRSYDLTDFNNCGDVVKISDVKNDGKVSNPSVAAIGDKIYLAYSSYDSIGIAVATQPTERFSQLDKKYIINDSFAPHLFTDNNNSYIYYSVKNGESTDIYGANFTGNGISGAKMLMSGADKAGVVKMAGKYYLMFSQTDGNEKIYCVSSNEPLGEYGNKTLALAAVEDSLGYTSVSAVNSPDGNEMFAIYQSNDNNGIYVDRISVSGGRFEIKATPLKQPVPSGTVRIMPLGDLSADDRTRKNDLMFAINLAAQNVTGSLDFDNNYFPVWNANITSNGNAIFGNTWHGHNIGRWMDAMYRWQNLTDTPIDPFLKNVMLNNTKWFFSNPDNICLQPAAEGVGTFFELHSLREGMAALNAIITYETGEWQQWALSTAEKMIVSIDEKLRPDMSWDYEKFIYRKTAQGDLNSFYDTVGSSARFCEALLRNHMLTQSSAGLALAKRIIDYNYNYSVKPNGDINYASNPNHTHSWQNMLQAMLLLGRITGEQKYVDRVKLAFENTVMRLVTPSGVVTHDLESGASGWETSSTSDAMQLAMWLVDEGYTEFADVAERLLRARLLPAQFVEGDKLKWSDTGAGLSWNMKDRVNGGYSMIFDSPYSGKFCTTDVTCHVLQALIDAQNHIVAKKGDDTYVMMHFDYEDSTIKQVVSRQQKGLTSIEIKKATKLYVRLPSFTQDVTIKVNGESVQIVRDDIYAVISNLSVGDTVTVEYDLPEKTTKERHTNHIEYTLKWKGDEIIGVSPGSTFLPMYK